MIVFILIVLVILILVVLVLIVLVLVLLILLVLQFFLCIDVVFLCIHVSRIQKQCLTEGIHRRLIVF